MLFVITVDDAGLGQSVEIERESIAFFARQDVPASFFVVPCRTDGGQLCDDPQWVRRARQYEAQGHDYQLHGCTHAGFEFGPPEHWMIQICGQAALQAEAEGFKNYQESWRPEVLREKFARAMAAFERAFERKPQVFRAGCLAAQETAFQVMGEIGLFYDSNKIVDPKAWDFIAGKFDSARPWDPKVPPHPYRLNDKVIELPCMGEFAWHPTEQSAPHFLKLALGDLERAALESGLFILMCHQQCVGGGNEWTRNILSELFREARNRYDAEFITLRTLVDRIERREIPVGRPCLGK